MTAPFDFKTWQALTGWSAPQVADRTGLSLSLIEKLAAGRVPVSERVAILCRVATAQHCAALRPFELPEDTVPVRLTSGEVLNVSGQAMKPLLTEDNLMPGHDGVYTLPANNAGVLLSKVLRSITVPGA